MEKSFEKELTDWLADNQKMIPLPAQLDSRQFALDLAGFSMWSKRCALSLVQYRYLRIFMVSQTLITGLAIYQQEAEGFVISLILLLVFGLALYSVNRHRQQVLVGAVILKYLEDATHGRRQGLEFLYSASFLWREVLQDLPDPAFPHTAKWIED